MDLLEVGKIVNTHGLRGEVKIVPWTDSPDVFEELEYVIIKKRSGDITLNIKGIKSSATVPKIFIKSPITSRFLSGFK